MKSKHSFNLVVAFLSYAAFIITIIIPFQDEYFWNFKRIFLMLVFLLLGIICSLINLKTVELRMIRVWSLVVGIVILIFVLLGLYGAAICGWSNYYC